MYKTNTWRLCFTEQKAYDFTGHLKFIQLFVLAYSK